MGLLYDRFQRMVSPRENLMNGPSYPFEIAKNFTFTEAFAGLGSWSHVADILGCLGVHFSDFILSL